MIAWYFVWGELLVWTTLITIQVLPVPLVIKNLMVKAMNALWKNFYLRAFFIANMCVIVFQFGDSYNQMLKYQANKDALGAGMTTGAGSLGEKLDINMKLFRAQRNLYLSFFCLFEILIFYGFCKLIDETQKERTETTEKKIEKKTDKIEKKVDKKIEKAKAEVKSPKEVKSPEVKSPKDVKPFVTPAEQLKAQQELKIEEQKTREELENKPNTAAPAGTTGIKSPISGQKTEVVKPVATSTPVKKVEMTKSPMEIAQPLELKTK